MKKLFPYDILRTEEKFDGRFWYSRPEDATLVPCCAHTYADAVKDCVSEAQRYASIDPEAYSIYEYENGAAIDGPYRFVWEVVPAK